MGPRVKKVINTWQSGLNEGLNLALGLPFREGEVYLHRCGLSGHDLWVDRIESSPAKIWKFSKAAEKQTREVSRSIQNYPCGSIILAISISTFHLPILALSPFQRTTLSYFARSLSLSPCILYLCSCLRRSTPPFHFLDQTFKK